MAEKRLVPDQAAGEGRSRRRSCWRCSRGSAEQEALGSRIMMSRSP